MSDDEEFDMPDADAYFDDPDPIPSTRVTSKQLVEDFADEFAIDDLDQEPTAAHSCLGLPEILERIILFVPQLEVYRLQLVSTMFRDLITRSIPIRRHMYFVPERYFVRKELNDLLDWKSTRKSKLAEAVFPLCFELYSHHSGAGVKASLDSSWASAHERSPPNRLFPEDDRLSNETASWRTILVLDSAAPLEVQYHVQEGWSNEWHSVHTQITQATPITLGDVVDCAKPLVLKAWKDRRTRRSAFVRDALLSGVRHPIYSGDVPDAQYE